MKIVEFPYYLGDQVIELTMFDNGDYDYEIKYIKKISIDENENIELYYNDFDFICYAHDIDSFKELGTCLSEVYIFSSLDKMYDYLLNSVFE